MSPEVQPLPQHQPTTVEQSVSRDSAFSKPGSTTASKGWKPARGTRFRSTNEKARGRPRKKARDKRRPLYY